MFYFKSKIHCVNTMKNKLDILLIAVICVICRKYKLMKMFPPRAKPINCKNLNVVINCYETCISLNTNAKEIAKYVDYLFYRSQIALMFCSRKIYICSIKKTPYPISLSMII